MNISIFTSIFSPLFTLVIAYGIDYWLFLQMRYLRQAGDGGKLFLWGLLGGLLLGVIWLGLSLMVLGKNRRNIALSIFYILIGLISFVLFPIEFIGPIFLSNLIKNIFIFPSQPIYLQFTGLFVAVLGFLTLLLTKNSPGIYK